NEADDHPASLVTGGGQLYRVRIRLQRWGQSAHQPPAGGTKLANFLDLFDVEASPARILDVLRPFRHLASIPRQFSLGVEDVDLNDASGGQRSLVRDVCDWRITHHTSVPVVFPVDRHWRETGWQCATGPDMIRVEMGRLCIEIDRGALAYVY